MTADVLVVSGSGPYADPWHDFAATSARVADLLEGSGRTVDRTDDVEVALSQVEDHRLIVLNLGNWSTPRPAETVAAVRAGLARRLASGTALLGLHASLGSEVVEPRRVLGGAWVHGRSSHPPRGVTTIRRTGTVHPLAADLTDITVDDERYSDMDTEPGIAILYDHDHDGRTHPLVWAWETDRHRAVYDALGHDEASFDSPSHRALLLRAVTWLLGED